MNRAQDFSWPRWVALIPLAIGLLLLLLWIGVKSCSYRLTDQRLFVRRGWLAKPLFQSDLFTFAVQRGLVDPQDLGRFG